MKLNHLNFKYFLLNETKWGKKNFLNLKKVCTFDRTTSEYMPEVPTQIE